MAVEIPRSEVLTADMKLFFYVFLFSLTEFSLIVGADPRGDHLIDQYLNQSARHDAVLSIRVDHTRPGAEPVGVEFTWIRRVREDSIAHLLRIDSPSAERGKLLLVHEGADGTANYVAYRPNSALKKKVRLSGTRDYEYKGLKISVQEIIGGELLKYSHRFDRSQSLDGIGCQIVVNRLKPQFNKDSDYQQLRIFLRDDNGMPLRAELFEKSGLSKVIYFEEIRKIQGIWTITRARVEELKEHGQVVVTLKEAQYRPELEDCWFSEECLKQTSKSSGPAPADEP
jgi:Outer membrane lipoprotein-sorting protein